MAETPQRKQLKSNSPGRPVSTRRRAEAGRSLTWPLLADDLTKAVSELDQRIKDLEDFDVKTIMGRFNAKTKALEDKVNETLSNIFGQNSTEYRKNSILTLDTLPIIFGGSEYPSSTLQQAYQKGINDCVTKLKSLKETLEQEQLDTK